MNKIILIGRLTKNPELKYTNTNNIPVCNFTLAIDRRFQKEGEEKQTDFINCIAWNKTAEFVNNWFTKGKKIALSGRLQVRSWDDENGKRNWITEVIAEEVEFADSKPADNQNNNVNVENNQDTILDIDNETELPF